MSETPPYIAWQCPRCLNNCVNEGLRCPCGAPGPEASAADRAQLDTLLQATTHAAHAIDRCVQGRGKVPQDVTEAYHAAIREELAFCRRVPA